jgi:hypothetical protein
MLPLDRCRRPWPRGMRRTLLRFHATNMITEERLCWWAPWDSNPQPADQKGAGRRRRRRLPAATPRRGPSTPCSAGPDGPQFVPRTMPRPGRQLAAEDHAVFCVACAMSRISMYVSIFRNCSTRVAVRRLTGDRSSCCSALALVDGIVHNPVARAFGCGSTYLRAMKTATRIANPSGPRRKRSTCSAPPASKTTPSTPKNTEGATKTS